MTSDEENELSQSELSRRAMLKGTAAAVGAAAAGLVTADAASAEAKRIPPVNPYGGGPGTGLQFPPYYKPTPSVRSRNNYFPGSEVLE